MFYEIHCVNCGTLRREMKKYPSICPECFSTLIVVLDDETPLLPLIPRKADICVGCEKECAECREFE